VQVRPQRGCPPQHPLQCRRDQRLLRRDGREPIAILATLPSTLSLRRPRSAAERKREPS
jgi:hypothetical protein